MKQVLMYLLLLPLSFGQTSGVMAPMTHEAFAGKMGDRSNQILSSSKKASFSQQEIDDFRWQAKNAAIASILIIRQSKTAGLWAKPVTTDEKAKTQILLLQQQLELLTGAVEGRTELLPYTRVKPRPDEPPKKLAPRKLVPKKKRDA